MMQKRKLGTTEVSPLGIGAMSFGPFYGPTTQDESFGVLDAAVELGEADARGQPAQAAPCRR